MASTSDLLARATSTPLTSAPTVPAGTTSMAGETDICLPRETALECDEYFSACSRRVQSRNESIPQCHAFSPRIGAARPARRRAHDAVQAARFGSDAHAVAHALELRREPL